MRRIIKNNWLRIAFGLSAMTGLLLPCQVAAAASTGGVTITPAALTLNLAKGQQTQTATITVANHYQTAVTLHGSLAQPVATPGTASALSQLQLTPADLTIPANASAAMAVTVSDNAKLAPGSQQIDLVLTQLATPGNSVSVVPSIRLPLIVIKEDGAITALSASAPSKPGFAFDLPGKVTVAIKNTGNMIAIPRGYVQVLDPRGREVSKGIVNGASTAVVPGDQLRASIDMTTLDHAWLPGMYRVQVAYGTGGGAAATLVSARFFYLPVWQILLVLLLGALAYTGYQIWMEWSKLQRLKSDKPPKRPNQSLNAGKGVA
ncbi:MAG TPA: hypothetical protein VF466_00590 [Candidatus Saccharimonadales bacterium]